MVITQESVKLVESSPAKEYYSVTYLRLENDKNTVQETRLRPHARSHVSWCCEQHMIHLKLSRQGFTIGRPLAYCKKYHTSKAVWQPVGHHR
jgi:hypothetical protein